MSCPGLLPDHCLHRSQSWPRLYLQGLTIVGQSAVAMTGFIILPFLVLIGMSLPHVNPSNWVAQDWDAVQWGPFLNVMFW